MSSTDEVRTPTDEERRARLEAAIKKSSEMVLWDQLPEKPVPVEKVFAAAAIGLGRRDEPGRWVRVRPCGDEKTYLGILLGNLPTKEPPIVGYHPGEKELSVVLQTNPCIFVPDLGSCVWGYESWWGVVESPDDLRQITDASIGNVWYVQALKSLGAAGPEPAEGSAPPAGGRA